MAFMNEEYPKTVTSIRPLMRSTYITHPTWYKEYWAAKNPSQLPCIASVRPPMRSTYITGVAPTWYEEYWAGRTPSPGAGLAS